MVHHLFIKFFAESYNPKENIEQSKPKTGGIIVINNNISIEQYEKFLKTIDKQIALIILLKTGRIGSTLIIKSTT